MALKKLDIEIKWENGNLFQFIEKNDPPTPDVIIVKVQENSKIASLWPSVANICSIFLREKLDEIGKEMAAP